MLARYSALAVWLQLGIGLLNIMLSAPSWMQLLHLLVAQLVWIGLTLTVVSAQTEASHGTSEGSASA
jgi:heme A synthase